MLRLPTYEIKEELHYGLRTVAYRAIRLSDKKKVILKTLRQLDHPPLKEVAAIEHEYEMLENIDVEGVIHVYDLVKVGDTSVIVLEDMGGQPLKDFLAHKSISLEKFFKIALQLIKIIGELHQKDIIHKDIKPTNIIINPIDLTVKLTDFSIATHIEYESQPAVMPNVLEGSLGYMSPEQTGRMNRMVDYRTDFYSLGITFFEMLVGHLPFETEDLMELVHYHLAKIPPLISDIDSKIPLQVAAIINKMMAKNAEDRYITAAGIYYDLAKCEQEWQQLGRIDAFPLGVGDITDRLKIPQKLYGREEQIKILLETFNQVSKGAPEIVFVTGYSGVGKSSLVHEIDKPIAKERGYYISGKYDKLQKNVPYSAFTKAFDELAGLLLSEPEAKLIEIKRQILDVVGPNGQLLIDFSPQFENIIGKQFPVPAASLSESQNRFNNIFKKIINIFANSKHPLVIFLDDMQWADMASLDLIKTFLSSAEYLLVIGAYRENEVDESHPLFGYIKNLIEEKIIVNELRLQPLNEDNISDLLMDTLSVTKERVRTLSAIVKAKTEGNPFFINAFLKSICNQKALQFSYEEHKWQWSVAEIENLGITDNVVDLLTKQIETLQPLHQNLISLAACIGTTVDLEMLTIISQKGSKETALALHEIVQAGLMFPIGGQYLQAESVENISGFNEKVYYKFAHDKVQQAAYSLMDEETQSYIHLKIGRILLKKSANSDDLMFTILDHFNKAVNLITDEEEKLKLARLNLAAGKRAKFSNAYNSAGHYLLAGIQLINPERHWDDRYELVFDLFKEYATCTYLANDLETAEKHFNFLLEKSKTKLDKASIYTLKGMVFAHKLLYEKAVDAFRQGLKVYDIVIPNTARKFDVLKEVLKIKFMVRGRDAKKLVMRFNKTADPDQLIIADLLTRLPISALFYDLNLYGYCVCRALNFGLKNGIMTGILQTSSLFTVMLITVFNDIKAARVFYTLVLKLLDKTDDDLDKARAYNGLGAMLNHWFQPAHLDIGYMDKSIQIGTRIGANYGTGLSMVFRSGKFIFSDKSLEEAANVIQKTKKELQILRHTTSLAMLQVQEIMVDQLLNRKILSDDEFEKYRKDFIESKSTPSLYSLYSLQMFVHYELGNYKKAVEFGDANDKYFRHTNAIYLTTITKMTYLLSMLKYYPLIPHDHFKEKKDRYKKIKNSLKIIGRWKKINPINYAFMYDICYAEYQKIFGRDKTAADYYDKAIIEAQKMGLCYFNALANERAGEFYLETDRPKLARAYIQDSHYAYLRWGAKFKYDKMEQIYPQWLKLASESKQSSEASLSLTTSSTDSVHALDFVSIIKATQTISGEIILNKLLEKMLKIMVENGGAERGVFIVENGGQLLVAAESTLEKSIATGQLCPVESYKDLPLSIIRYVYRTQEPVVLNDATVTGNFVKDTYIVKDQSKSVLCMPVLHKNQTVGILYLQNNVATNVFTTDRFQALKLIASQAAISLENARLYTASGHFVPFPFLERLHKRNIGEVRLGDQIQSTLSIMFCDIRDFTALSENQSPEETFQFINQFLGVMEPIIREHSGFTDKYIGDAIMALFDGDSDNAVRAAVQMIGSLERFNKSRAQDGKSTINVGIGINTGDLMLGIIGNQERMESSVIGSPVNIAARVEDLTKYYGVNVLITEETRSTLQHQERFSLRLIDEVLVKGKTQPIKVWEVCDTDTAETKLHKLVIQETFDQARALFIKEDFIKSEKLFQNCIQETVNDPVINFYLNECRKRINQS